MPIARSRKQFRFLQAVAHGHARKGGSLSAASAKAGLSESPSYKSLPESKGSKMLKRVAKRKKR